MELQGKYAVAYVGQALYHLIKKENLTLCSGSIKFDFSKLICLNEKRHTLANTLLRIIYIYSMVNNLFSNDFSIETFTDDLLSGCFAMEIPASNFSIEDKIISMNKAIKLKLIRKKINTFETIKKHNDKFDHANLLPKDLNRLMTFNSIPLKTKRINDDSIGVYISKEEVDQLVLQNILVHQIFIVLRKTQTMRKRLENFERLRMGLSVTKIDQTQKVNLIEFIKIAIVIVNIMILDELRKDENINLLYAIIISDFELVTECLKMVNPRCNNNEYYLVAVQIGNGKIINLIRDTIIMNIWLEKHIFINGFKLLEQSNSYLDITLHMKNTIYV